MIALDFDHLQRAISHDLELVATGKVTEFKDPAVVRATKVSPMEKFFSQSEL